MFRLQVFYCIQSLLRGEAYLERSKQHASLGIVSRKTDKLLLLNISLIESVHLTDISVFFAVKNIKSFVSYRRCPRCSFL